MSGGLIGGGVGLLVGFGLGTLLSETVKNSVASSFGAMDRRRVRGSAMKSVVMEVNPDWEGYGYEVNEFDLAGMKVEVVLRNYSDQLVRNVRVRMNRRPNGTDTAAMQPALPAGGSPVTVVIKRGLGLIEDQPFDEEEENWLDMYWFEADYEDIHNKPWRLTYNPRDDRQWVERLASH